MRGNLTDQDLTDYALNELEPGHRLYVESMLAVSTECRNDIYEMLELARMLEEGFEQEARITGVATLTPEQRVRLTKPRRHKAALAFLQKTAATVSVAACVAFALANPGLWHGNDGASQVAKVSSKVTQIVAEAVPVTESVDISSFMNIETLADDSSDILQVAQPAVVCTPPSWLENSEFSNVH